MTVIPAVLVLIVGSRVVLTAVDRWFNAPMEEILAGANSIAGDYYQERERMVADQASRLARSLSRVDLASAASRERAERRHAGSGGAAHRHGAGVSRGALPDQSLEVCVARRRRVTVDAAGVGARLRRSAGGARGQRQRSGAERPGADGGRRRADARRERGAQPRRDRSPARWSRATICRATSPSARGACRRPTRTTPSCAC